MIVAILAYGYDVANLDIDHARTLLLSAAHAEGRMTEFSARGLLDDDGTRDPDYQLGLLDLTLQPVGDGHGDRFVLASYMETTEDDHEPVAVITAPPQMAEPDILRWAKTVLGVPADEEPRWMLCWDALG